MIRTWQAVGVIVVVALAVAAAQSRADETAKPPSPDVLLKALAEAGKPGPELQKLQPLVGDWTFTLKMWTDPSQSPAELKGTVERKWVMGGRFVQEAVKGQYDGQSFEGLGLWGYDNAQKKFTRVQVCGFCGMVSHNLSTSNASGTKFEFPTEACCPLTGEKIKGRDEVLIEGNDKVVVNIYKTISGQEAKVMEIVSIRKK